MTDRSAVGRRSKAKGKEFERTVATMLRRCGVDCRRGWQARSGSDACDVEGTDWWIECGTGRAVNPVAKLEQAEGAALAAGDPRRCVAVCRAFGSPRVTATLRLYCACVSCAPRMIFVPVTMDVRDWICLAFGDGAAQVVSPDAAVEDPPRGLLAGENG